MNYRTSSSLFFLSSSVISSATLRFNDILPSEERIRFLNDKIKGVSINMEEVDDDDADEFSENKNTEKEEHLNKNEDFNSDWKSWSDDQYGAARETGA